MTAMSSLLFPFVRFKAKQYTFLVACYFSGRNRHGINPFCGVISVQAFILLLGRGKVGRARAGVS